MYVESIGKALQRLFNDLCVARSGWSYSLTWEAVKLNPIACDCAQGATAPKQNICLYLAFYAAAFYAILSSNIKEKRIDSMEGPMRPSHHESGIISKILPMKA